MGVFLKIIGSGLNPCPEPYEKLYADFSPTRRPRQIHEGDHLILYAAGGRKCVFAVARVTSEVKASDYPDWPYRLDIEYLVNVSPADGVLIDQVSIERDLGKLVRRQSYIRLTMEEYNRAASLLEEADGRKDSI
jgi:alpha-D-ribose 1-methylphosphonate 5-phosphate C-P lyase